MKVELLYDAKATLGEGPAWDAKTNSLYWVDILEKRIHVHADENRLIQLQDYVSCVAPCTDGSLVLTHRFGVWTLKLDSGKLTEISVPSGEPNHNRFNDGKCDPAGRLIAGTMDMGEREASGSLYSFQANGSYKKLLGDIRISNGLAWSPDHKTLYYIDTPTREVKAFDYDVTTGEIANPRTALTIPAEFGWPDGMTSDTQGHLWICMWGGAQVTRWDVKQARLLDQIQIPAWNVTSCAFGGKNMDQLYVTSARTGMDEADLKEYPLTGGLFKVETNVVGMPTFQFGN
jgi:sugar lactone lactonase YvrE